MNILKTEYDKFFDLAIETVNRYMANIKSMNPPKEDRQAIFEMNACEVACHLNENEFSIFYQIALQHLRKRLTETKYPILNLNIWHNEWIDNYTIPENYTQTDYFDTMEEAEKVADYLLKNGYNVLGIYIYLDHFPCVVYKLTDKVKAIR